VIASIDLVPTLATLCRAKLSAGYVADGEDLNSAFRGEMRKRTKPLFWEYGRNETSFDYPKNATHRSPNVAVRDGDWKLLLQADGSRAELYNIVADPEERNNVAEKHPEIKDRLAAAAVAWRKSMP
jgi:arylsulfatase A-like enzyme